MIPGVEAAGRAIGEVLGPLAQLGGAAGVISSSFATMQPHLIAISIVADSMFKVLGPVIQEVLRPIISILATWGRYLGAILVPVFRIVGAVAEILGEVFQMAV